jgi:glycosyltransferase involved in cell wall biosynthesis
MSNAGNVAVIILTYNEALHLGRALDHVASFAKDVLVVDSYSTDGTVQIAKDRGAHVLEHPFQNYAKQFEWALENIETNCEWVMRLDADEVIEADLAEEILTKLPNLPQSVTGINLKRKTIFQGRFIRHGGRYPLTLLRIWRRGKALIEDRWMDEHMYLTEGSCITFNGGFADHNLFDITAFTQKHNKYASREALDVLNTSLHLFDEDIALTSRSTAQQAKIKRFFKESVYNRVPFEVSAFAYFILRYVFQMGFLDGREGLVYHVLQGFWYRFLVGVKLRELEKAVRQAGSKEEARREVARLTGLSLSAERTQ